MMEAIADIKELVESYGCSLIDDEASSAIVQGSGEVMSCTTYRIPVTCWSCCAEIGAKQSRINTSEGKYFCSASCAGIEIRAAQLPFLIYLELIRMERRKAIREGLTDGTISSETTVSPGQPECDRGLDHVEEG